MPHQDVLRILLIQHVNLVGSRCSGCNRLRRPLQTSSPTGTLLLYYTNSAAVGVYSVSSCTPGCNARRRAAAHSNGQVRRACRSHRNSCVRLHSCIERVAALHPLQEALAVLFVVHPCADISEHETLRGSAHSSLDGAWRATCALTWRAHASVWLQANA